ncbi:MAG: efflux RND transporter periplasmic adaptor subunit [Candidatus Zixiibacteriota bacterium]
MKTVIISLFAILAVMAVGLLSTAITGNKELHAETKVGAQLYTCGMHPEIISDEPGYCPICGMKLTLKKDGSSSMTGTISIDPTTTQNMGIRTTSVKKQTLTKTVKAFGKAAYDESLVYSVDIKIDGWVEKLYVDQSGQSVAKNQPLLEIYSPRLVTAQKEYLVAYEQYHKNQTSNIGNLLTAARQRLTNWDISKEQIEKLEKDGEIVRTMTIYSPANGIITKKNLTDGVQLKAGQILYEIVDLSTVWVKAYLYEQDVPFISVGQTVEINFPNTSEEKYQGKINYIAPFLDNKNQTEIRVTLANSKNIIRPDMYAEVNIKSELAGKRLVIPRSAIINSGTKQVIYIDEGDGSYSPHVIETGVVGENDMVEVISGLNDGEIIVTSGQFMLDSESRLNEALADNHPMGHDNGGQSQPMRHGENNKMNTDKMISMKADSEELVATGGHDIYTCPMPSHYHVLQYGEGKCPECGMNLVPLGKTENKQVYVCPMTECGTVQDHNGTCPVCGMNLVRYQPEAPHDQ